MNMIKTAVDYPGNTTMIGLYTLEWKTYVIEFVEASQWIIKWPATAPNTDCRCQISPELALLCVCVCVWETHTENDKIN